jgi:hypothetical protein
MLVRDMQNKAALGKVWLTVYYLDSSTVRGLGEVVTPLSLEGRDNGAPGGKLIIIGNCLHFGEGGDLS